MSISKGRRTNLQKLVLVSAFALLGACMMVVPVAAGQPASAASPDKNADRRVVADNTQVQRGEAWAWGWDRYG